MASTALNHVHQHKEEEGNIEDKDLEKASSCKVRHA